ncbi:TMEM175 family protein [Methanobrevibacter sp.]|uniref:TMEM175 family protein n=1 Tax=Methanobrevibacter sp. TaxID=66852 RepID=UPI00388D3D50
MSDRELENKYKKLIEIKKHLDAIKEDWDEETLDELKEFVSEKYASSNLDNEKINLIESSVNNTSDIGIVGRIKNAFESDVGIDPGRLLGLTDGIFGMVMTLLVFGIAVPEAVSSYSNYISFFTTLAPTIAVTIISFVIISSFWIYHHEFIKINNLNLPYLWLNILFLICLSFIPFTTSLIGNYSQFFISEAIFGLNILLTIISFMLMYVYAFRRDFLENKPSKQENVHVFTTLGSIMVLVMIVNLLDFFVSSKFIYLFLLIPVISTILDVIYNYKNS